MLVSVIARLTFHEAYRRKILWAALGLGIVFLTIFGLGLNEIWKDVQQSLRSRSVIQEREIVHFFLMSGLYVVNFLTIMMTVLTSVDTLAGEIASGTIHALVAKPIRRWELLVGKWLGFSLMLTLYLVFMAGGVHIVGYIVTGHFLPHAIIGLGLMWLNALLLLNTSLLGGSSLSTLANGVLAFGLYGVAFIGGWVEQFGAMLQNQTAVNIGIIVSLIFPSEALWKRAAYEMQSPLAGSLGFSPFAAPSVPSTMMIVYACGYVIITFLVALRAFGRRDL